MGTSTERRERAREMAGEMYRHAGLYPNDYEALVDVFVKQPREHDGDEAKTLDAAWDEIESRMRELAEDDPYWADLLGWTESEGVHSRDSAA